jgi:hypothetical protein
MNTTCTPSARVSLRRVSVPRARRAVLAARASTSEEHGLVLSSFTSSGLALSGSVASATTGGVYTVRDDVKVTRSEEAGNTTVTIKARSLRRAPRLLTA